MWPSDTGGSCVPLWRKRKYPCVQSSVTMDNLCVAHLVWAMPDCFPVQYKFLYYDEPCFLKEGTVPSVRETGQGWGWMDRQEEEALICSLLHHGEAMAKHIKASFRSPVWSQSSSVPFFIFCRRPNGCVDRAGTSSMQRQRSGNILRLWKMERKRKGWMGRREGMGHLGIFVRHMKERLCWGAHSALRIDCVLHVFTGGCMNIWLMSHRLGGNVISEQWLYKASPSHSHTQTHTPCPPV